MVTPSFHWIDHMILHIGPKLIQTYFADNVFLLVGLDTMIEKTNGGAKN